ncbi:hypothetical protein FN846DRAFT_513108 [Sphaerosporella brunnea]|uniref:Uncharacterized protein n=1 Tax=Sphaerosporella brunnea TaxID=1250544 RepID=A0A5J5F439_9PEZI|nr:hypothetical protein FN846DRAFT_513108 [Sphaerosporella brunnea]
MLIPFWMRRASLLSPSFMLQPVIKATADRESSVTPTLCHALCSGEGIYQSISGEEFRERRLINRNGRALSVGKQLDERGVCAFSQL